MATTEVCASPHRTVVPLVPSIILVAFAIHEYTERDELRSQVAELEELVGEGGMVEETEAPEPATKIRALIEETKQLERDCTRIFLVASILAAAAYVRFLWRYYLWGPFARMRSRFSYEISRAVRIIRALATREESAQLAALDIAVCDEKTLRAYVGQMVALARQYDVVGLTAEL